MNIFILDKDPIKAAEYHADGHIAEKILQSGFILSSVHKSANTIIDKLHQLAYIKHPWNKWANECKENYEWLYKYFNALNNEYKLRYNRYNPYHDSIDSIVRYTPSSLSDIKQTPFVLIMPDRYKDFDAVKAYRNYYINEKLKFATWRFPAKVPEWILKRKT